MDSAKNSNPLFWHSIILRDNNGINYIVIMAINRDVK